MAINEVREVKGLKTTFFSDSTATLLDLLHPKQLCC